MKVLRFQGNQVGYFDSIDEVDNGVVQTSLDIIFTFEPDDVIEIVITDPDDDIEPNGEFTSENSIEFSSVTLIRNGERFEFDVDDGSTIKESDGSAKEQGDTFFTTNDSVEPPTDLPDPQIPPDLLSDFDKLVFSSDTTFTTGETTTIPREVDQDFDMSGSIEPGPPEEGNGIFNIMPVMPPPPCFLPETLIATPDGEMAAGDLKLGDMVTTLDNGPQQILWSGRRTVLLPAGIDRDRPILIRAGSLGSRQPNRDLKLSPRHHLFFDCDRSSGRSAKGLLAPAKGLTRLPGIRYMRGKRSVTYISLLMARHEVIFAEGQPVESFFPGPTAMQMLDSRMQAEIYALFPGLMTDPLNGYGTRARPLLKRRETERRARQLLVESIGLKVGV